MRRATTVLALGLLALAGPALAKAKPKQQAATGRGCERAAYPGDPVCDVGDAAGALPMPSTRGVSPVPGQGYRVSDDVSVAGKSDFNDHRFGGERFNNPNPNPRSQDVNGGGAVNYRF